VGVPWDIYDERRHNKCRTCASGGGGWREDIRKEGGAKRDVVVSRNIIGDEFVSGLEEVEAAVNALIQFPDLEMESQYVEEATSFPETHYRGPIYQA